MYYTTSRFPPLTGSQQRVGCKFKLRTCIHRLDGEVEFAKLTTAKFETEQMKELIVQNTYHGEMSVESAALLQP